MTTALAAILGYFALQLAIGIWISRRIRSETDYLLAGRSLGYGLATFSIFATWFGAETIVGAAGTTYQEGLSLSSAEPFGYGLCLVLMGLIFAAPLWRRKLTTLADFFRQRYSPGVERFAAIILIPSSVLWAAAQVRAFAQVLATSSTLEVDVAMSAAAAFVILYTVFGGLLADAITDLIQGIVLIIALVIVGVGVVAQLGGAPAAIEAVASSGAIRFAGGGGSLLQTLEAWAIPVCGSLVATEIVARVIATRSPDVARRSALMGGGLYLLVGLIPVFVGLVGPVFALDLADPEQLMPAVARQILPVALYALFAGGLISAILSTVDSTLLVASGLLSHNLLVPALRIGDERTKVRLARAGVVGLGIIAWVLARRAEGVFALVEQASALGSAGALVTVTFGLFTGLGGARTATATLAAGMLVYLAASYADAAYPFLGSLVAALVTYLAGSAIEVLAARVVSSRAADGSPSPYLTAATTGDEQR